mgnify:CR=1 FL=1
MKKRNIFLLVMIILMVIASLSRERISKNNWKQDYSETTFSEFSSMLRDGCIESATVETDQYKINAFDIIYFKANGSKYMVKAPKDNIIVQTMLSKCPNIDFRFEDISGVKSFRIGDLVGIIILTLFVIGIVAIVMSSRGEDGPMNIGGGSGGIRFIGNNKKHNKSDNDDTNTTTFADVAGAHEAKDSLMEIVKFLKSPEKFDRIGCKITRGILLEGPPGNGKTLLAKAAAGEAGVPFFLASGSSFDEMFVGVGASRIRELFKKARKMAPSIIFIDEIDAVGRKRDSSPHRSGESDKTLNQLLVEMDGFQRGSDPVIVIGATNLTSVLDEALLRPGRFDRKIYVPLPDLISREKILQVHSRKLPLAPDIDIKEIAKCTAGFSGASLAFLMNEAAIISASHDRLSITMTDVNMAKDKIILGDENKTLQLDEYEKKMTAYHEAGHASIAILYPTQVALHKVTIVPRRGALGLTSFVHQKDVTLQSLYEMLSHIKMCMGGRIAEEIFYGKDKITSGASNDILQATDMVTRMVINYGFSDKIGFINYRREEDYGARLPADVQEEINRIVNEQYQEAYDIMLKNKDKVSRLAEALYEMKTIEADDAIRIFNGEDALAKTQTSKCEEIIEAFRYGGIPNDMEDSEKVPDSDDNNDSSNNIDLAGMENNNENLSLQQQ